MTSDLKARLDAMGQAIFFQHDDPAKETPEVWRDIFEAVAIDLLAKLVAAEAQVESLKLERKALEVKLLSITAERDVYHEVCTLREVRLTKERNELIRFICHYGGLANEWAKQCPFGTKLTEHIRGELNRWLKAEARALKEDRDAE